MVGWLPMTGFLNFVEVLERKEMDDYDYRQPFYYNNENFSPSICVCLRHW